MNGCIRSLPEWRFCASTNHHLISARMRDVTAVIHHKHTHLDNMSLHLARFGASTNHHYYTKEPLPIALQCCQNSTAVLNLLDDGDKITDETIVLLYYLYDLYDYCRAPSARGSENGTPSSMTSAPLVCRE